MKRGFKILLAVFRIYFLHLTAILAVWLGMYFPGLDIILAILYLVFLWQEGRYSLRLLNNPEKVILVAGIWQTPGLILAVSVLTGLDTLAEFAYYFVFMLELWLTPVLPLISAIPTFTIFDKPFYYYCFFILVPLLAAVYCFPALTCKPEKY